MPVVLWQAFIKQKRVTSQLELLHSGNQGFPHRINVLLVSQCAAGMIRRRSGRFGNADLGMRGGKRGLAEAALRGPSEPSAGRRRRRRGRGRGRGPATQAAACVAARAVRGGRGGRRWGVRGSGAQGGIRPRRQG